ncbi:MAG: M23 family metallopeptidase [Spirochaetota bacterium]
MSEEAQMTRLRVRSVAALFATVVGLLTPATLATEERYRFPVAVDPGTLTWDERHWDGSKAVDLSIHPEFRLDAPERAEFYRARVAAVVGGRAMRLDNPRGGIAVLLHGDDGRSYYYAHLDDATIDEPRIVAAGEALGTIGRTGTWTSFLEEHLHFSIAHGHVTGTEWDADVSASRWLHRTFGLAPRAESVRHYRPDRPDGLPLFGRPTVVRDFQQTGAEDARLAGLVLSSTSDGAGDGSAAIRAPLTGLVRVHRDTALGTRIQITNEHARSSVIVSGEIEATARGGIVHAGDVVGFVTGPLHYMVFDSGDAVDPLR